MNKIILTFVFLTLTFISSSAQTPEERELSKALSQAVVTVSKNLPMTLDEDTRLDSVSTVRNFMVYNNTLVKYKAAELDPNSLDEILADVVIKPLCGNKALKSFIDLGVIMVYRYFGNDGQFVTELSKDMSTCTSE